MTAIRRIYGDVETTGLTAATDRIIEIGLVEYRGRRRTERDLHLYLDPEQEIERGATEIHGMTWDMLRGKPVFAEVADEVLEYLQGAELLIHNADFDISFLDAEFRRLGRDISIRDICTVVDTLELSRRKNPGARHSLDKLCDRYGVSRDHRDFHGALLDATLLGEVHQAMTVGQGGLDFDTGATAAPRVTAFSRLAEQVASHPLLVMKPTEEEMQLHLKRMNYIAGKSSKEVLDHALLPS